MRAATALLALVAVLLMAAVNSYQLTSHSSRKTLRLAALLSTNDGSLIPNGNGEFDDGEELKFFDFLTGVVSRRKRTGGYRSIRDSRETLPFYVQIMQSDGTDPVYIGTYMLDHSTSNDDLLNLGDKGFYKVKKTTFIYKFKTNRLEVVKKKLDVSPVDKGFYSSNSLQ